MRVHIASSLADCTWMWYEGWCVPVTLWANAAVLMEDESDKTECPGLPRSGLSNRPAS